MSDGSEEPRQPGNPDDESFHRRPWNYDMRCLECRAEYSASPRGISIGPLGDYVMNGSEIINGTENIRIERLYRGTVTRIDCPTCLLRISVASDLIPDCLGRYLEHKAAEIEDLKMEEVFNMRAGIAFLRPFPVHCPRCTAMIDRPAQTKACKFCGSTLLALIGSYRL